MAVRVPHEKEIFAELAHQGFEQTGNKTKTGEFWRHKATGKHLQVPFSIDGYFPDWLCWLFRAQAGEIAAKAPKKKAASKPKRR